MGFVAKHKRPFRKRRNRIGEITEHCGTPEFTGYILELIPPIITRIERLHRKAIDSHRIKVLPIP